MPKRPPDPGFRERLQRLAKQKGIENNNQLAKAMNKTASATEGWWNGSYPVNTKDFKLLCRILGTTSDYLVFGEETPLPAIAEDFILIPMVQGRISAGGGLIPDNTIEMRVAFRKDWIARRDANRMSLIRVTGDSMVPTLLSGDIVLVDHSYDHIELTGGIYALAVGNEIMIKRVERIRMTEQIRIISDNSKYESYEIDPRELSINGKVIWFCRELER